MTLPLFPYEHINDLLNLLLAFSLGISFGFFLEQGGLGHPRVLINQFLLKDLTVFKVMFTAIITAMTGLFYFHYSGVLNLDLLNLSDTYIYPQLAGGLLLGFGFVIGAYCPGTCIVGISSGKKDALFFLAGLFIGMILFAELYNSISSFYFSGHIKNDKLYEIFNLDYGTIVLFVSFAAFLGFYLSERIEKKHD